MSEIGLYEAMSTLRAVRRLKHRTDEVAARGDASAFYRQRPGRHPAATCSALAGLWWCKDAEANVARLCVICIRPRVAKRYGQPCYGRSTRTRSRVKQRAKQERMLKAAGDHLWPRTWVEVSPAILVFLLSTRSMMAITDS